MGMKINKNAVNQAEKGTVIYAAKEQIDSVSIILKGRVLAVSDGAAILLGSGSFLGIGDLFAGSFLNSYIAYDDLTFYSFPVRQTDDLVNIFAVNKDYRGLAIASLVRILNESEKIYSSLQTNANQLFRFLHANYGIYLDTCKRLGYPAKTIPVIQTMEDYDTDTELDERKLLYYKECAKLPLDVWKAFCSAGDAMTIYLAEELSDLIMQINTECSRITAYILQLFDGLMSSSEICLFKNLAVLAISIEEANGYNDELLSIIDEAIDRINAIENLFRDKVGRKLTVDRERMEEIYYALLSKGDNRKEQVKNQFQYTAGEMEKADREMNNSLKQILQFGNLDSEKAKLLEKLIIDFMNLSDKLTADDSVRAIRRKLSELFYELYELVFFQAYQKKDTPRIIDLFLKYGFLDERLLTKEQQKELYYLDDKAWEESEPCCVFNMKDWLIQIYEGRKEPSKNDFDLDYRDMLRDKRKRGDITEAEEKELQFNLEKKVSYEIHNMFRYNHRLVNGQIITFLPFLWSDNFIKSINKLYVTAERVNAAVRELLEIDYSIFHRESLYVNSEKGIMKEYIMEQVFPDILLMPTVGLKSIMWQEISSKRKNSEGRFFLPIFTELSVKELLIKVFGRFRWELCRSIQGTSWNNIKYKSLTSEYADYIQFYRKNHDLSEEGKEKVKLQIQKGKNNYREIFVIDYEAWIKGEANGAIRLNKVARELLATYCPFARPIREKLKMQPLFADAMARFNRNSLKKVKDLELRYRALEKENIELTEELMETVIFFRDL